MDPATLQLLIRGVTELTTAIVPVFRQWGKNEEADKLDQLRKDLLAKSDATFDRIIERGRNDA
jgi:hypothetical protein